jgi:hypothetical protein
LAARIPETLSAIWHSMSGPKQHIDLPGVPVHPDAERFAGLAWMDMKPGVDELRSLFRPIAVYAMRWHENDR